MGKQTLGSVCLTAIVALACGGEESAAPAPLTENECTQLVRKIEGVLAEGIKQDEYIAYQQEPDAAIKRCVDQQHWSRTQFECAMKAGGKPGLNACLE